MIESFRKAIRTGAWAECGRRVTTILDGRLRDARSKPGQKVHEEPDDRDEHVDDVGRQGVAETASNHFNQGCYA